tara:strand:- start:343 stop:612 length:270 start_codon:yes stop_codon:yes gene_type:complete
MSWEDTLKAKKDDWVRKPHVPKPKMEDRIIEVLKRNPSGLKLKALTSLDLGNWSNKRVRKFLQNHPNIHVQRNPVGTTGNVKTLYYWRD